MNSNATTPSTLQEQHTEETKPIQQEVKATDTQIGGDHDTTPFSRCATAWKTT